MLAAVSPKLHVANRGAAAEGMANRIAVKAAAQYILVAQSKDGARVGLWSLPLLDEEGTKHELLSSKNHLIFSVKFKHFLLIPEIFAFRLGGVRVKRAPRI